MTEPSVRISSPSSNIMRAAVLGALDGETGRALQDLVTAALEQGAAVIEVDLRELTSYTSEGIANLTQLNSRRTFPDSRVVFIADTITGRAALIAAHRLTPQL